MQKEAAEQENERKQHRNQIKQIWNFTADEQENLFHTPTQTHTHPGSAFVCMHVLHKYEYTFAHTCSLACEYVCVGMCAIRSPAANCLGAVGIVYECVSVCQCLLWKQTD